MKTVVAAIISLHCFTHQGMKSLTCLWHLFLFLASIAFHGCSAIDTISVSEPVRCPVSIVSSGGTFKLEFFSLENTTKWYLGIMYNVPKMETVWVANRNKPLNDSSGILTISEVGNLVVLNGMKEVLWSSNASSPAPNSTAQLLENGNLVLRDGSNGRSVWESFQNPTDMLLEGMKIGVTENGTTKLTSWRSPSDPSTGSFTFGVNPLRVPELFVWNRGVLFWRSGPWDGTVLIGVPGMGTDVRSLHNQLVKGGNVVADYLTFDYINKSSLFHMQLSLFGDLRGIVFKGEGGWVVEFSNVMSECDLYGKCGPNGKCDPKSSPICFCLQGFDPTDMGDWTNGNWSGGCLLRKAPLQCQRNSSTGQQGEGDRYLKFTNVKIPDLSDIIAVSEEECSNDCSNNCSCSAYTFVLGIGCLHWTDSLIDIQQFSTHGSDLYVRLAHSESDSSRNKLKKRTIIASTATVGCLFLTASLYLLWSWWTKHRGVLETEVAPSDGSEDFKVEDLPVYRYETIVDATDNFNIRNKLGQGGFGAVYKGKLLDGQEIAVKRLSNTSSQGFTEFMNEVTLISKLQHRNLVRLLGCCVEREEKMLLYEYLPNKSLDAYLFDSGKQDLLDWHRRSIIIEGISRGLLYLHRDSRLRIIHRDLKASNILLDEHLNPKISDFGLARIFGGNQFEASTIRVVGTYGYMAPEYALNGKFSEKSDVYSFGVLLLEIVAGKRNTSFHQDEENISLLGYAWKLWSENEVSNLAFKKTLDPNVEMEIQRCAQVGLLCVQDSPNDRPNMSNVLLMLNSDIVDLPLPKYPVYTATFSVSESEEQPFLRIGHSNNAVSLTEVQGR